MQQLPAPAGTLFPLRVVDPAMPPATPSRRELSTFRKLAGQTRQSDVIDAQFSDIKKPPTAQELEASKNYAKAMKILKAKRDMVHFYLEHEGDAARAFSECCAEIETLQLVKPLLKKLIGFTIKKKDGGE